MRPRRLLAGLLLGALLAWGAGFLRFLVTIEAAPPPLPARADGIVALTGGAGRVEAALRLLAEGRGVRLLVSGVGHGAELGELAHRAGLPQEAVAPRTDIGRAATTTRGNAAETAAWAREAELHSLIVVTSAWHMPRALVEMQRAMPGVALYADPVPAEPGHPPSWRSLAAEYTKWAIAWLGLSRLELERRRPA